MKRDMKLVCQILFAVKQGEEPFDIEGYERDTIYRHIRMMSTERGQGNLLYVINTSDSCGRDRFILYITWDGFEFINIAKTLERALKEVSKLDLLRGICCYSFEDLKKALKTS